MVNVEVLFSIVLIAGGALLFTFHLRSLRK